MTYQWMNQYIGIPYVLGGNERDGLDCYGLVCMVLREQCGILLPNQGHFVRSKKELLVELRRGLLRQVEYGQCYRVDHPRDFDIMVQGSGTTVSHIGVWINNGLLHAADFNHGVAFDDQLAMRLKGITGTFYRWQV